MKPLNSQLLTPIYVRFTHMYTTQKYTIYIPMYTLCTSNLDIIKFALDVFIFRPECNKTKPLT